MSNEIIFPSKTLGTFIANVLGPLLRVYLGMAFHIEFLSELFTTCGTSI